MLLGAVFYIVFLAIFFGIAVGLLFALRTAKIL
jgi:cytochrome b6-f complex subunit 6